MEINKVLEERKNNLNEHMKKINNIKFKKNDVLVFDIEACAIKNHTEMLTYSIACISCFDDTDTMYWTNDVDDFLDTLLLSKAKMIKIYAHNCLYDVKPFLLRYVEKYGNKECKVKTYTKKEYELLNEDEKKECKIVRKSCSIKVEHDDIVYVRPTFSSTDLYTWCGSRLALKSKELAEYCGQQFIGIWKDYLFG